MKVKTVTPEATSHHPEVTHAQVAIVGAGPAGLTTARLLQLHGISAVVLERAERSHVETRLRAGVIEQPTVDLLTDIGAADNLRRVGMQHNGFYLRFDGATHNLDFHRFTGTHSTVYGQHLLVTDLISLCVDSDIPLLFSAEVTGIVATGDACTIRYSQAGQAHTVTADYVIAADGFHGAGRRAVPAPARDELIRDYPMAWLGILAESRPVAPEGMYCPHPDGLSVHSMRGPNLSRQYLQVPAGTDLAEWSDDRIWDELSHRAAADDAPPVERGPILDRSLATLRSYIARTMRHDRMFLIGDAAHIVPPTGAKGLNLAVGDAALVAQVLDAAINHGIHDDAERFSELALPRIMQAQRFSALLTTTLHAMPGADGFDEALRRATLERWVTSELAQRELGEVYLGLPFATAPSAGRTPQPVAT